MFRDIKEPAVLIETAGFLMPNTVQYRPPGAIILGGSLGASLGLPWTGGPQNAQARTAADPTADQERQAKGEALQARRRRWPVPRGHPGRRQALAHEIPPAQRQGKQAPLRRLPGSVTCRCAREARQRPPAPCRRRQPGARSRRAGAPGTDGGSKHLRAGGARVAPDDAGPVAAADGP